MTLLENGSMLCLKNKLGMKIKRGAVIKTRRTLKKKKFWTCHLLGVLNLLLIRTNLTWECPEQLRQCFTKNAEQIISLSADRLTVQLRESQSTKTTKDSLLKKFGATIQIVQTSFKSEEGSLTNLNLLNTTNLVRNRIIGRN